MVFEVGDFALNKREGYESVVEVVGESRSGDWGMREIQVKDVVPGRPYRYWCQLRFLEPMNEMEVLAWVSK
jgi:hypothetical protein